MSWDVWGPAILSSVAMTGLGGVLMKSIIESSVRHAFDRKIESLKGDIRAKEVQIADIKLGALSAANARHAELDRRRVNAAASLWEATVSERRFHTAIKIVQSLKLAEIQKITTEDAIAREKMKQMGGFMWNMSGLGNALPEDQSPERYRIFLPNKVWSSLML